MVKSQYAGRNEGERAGDGGAGRISKAQPQNWLLICTPLPAVCFDEHDAMRASHTGSTAVCPLVRMIATCGKTRWLEDQKNVHRILHGAGVVHRLESDPSLAESVARTSGCLSLT